MLSPKLPIFFKTSAHRQFNLKTRYYDAKKEERKNRLDSINSEKSKMSFQKDWEPTLRSAAKTSNKRFIIIFFVLAVISIILLKF